MTNIKIYSGDKFAFDLFHKEQVELFIDFHGFEQLNSARINILLALESHGIVPYIAGMAIKEQRKFNHILTYNEEILDNCKNAHLFEYGTTWIKQPFDFEKKKFEVSTLVGGKKMAAGHFIREKLWYEQERIKIPRNFFLSSAYPGDIQRAAKSKILEKEKEPMFESQFHIAIENIKMKYYFTEKVMDCFQTKTIPIYYGSAEIGKYFNLNGMYIVDNVDDIINVCNGLDVDTYESKRKFIEENYEKSKDYCDFLGRLKDKIEKLIK